MAVIRLEWINELHRFANTEDPNTTQNEPDKHENREDHRGHHVQTKAASGRNV